MLTAYRQKITVSCKCILVLFANLLAFLPAFGQNDNCANASSINIANNGFATGFFTSMITDISSATTEAGESFAPAIAAAGQTQKSIWFKFSLPTTRSLRVFLYETGGIVDGDVGLTVYKTSSCLPGNGDISTKFIPITTFTSSFNDCVEGGQYLIQVSAKSSANGQVYVRLQTVLPASPYDVNWQAYYFGTLTADTTSVSYEVSCQSLDDISEQCTALSNSQLYSKSTWNVFTTSSDLQTITLSLSTQSGAAGQKFGFRLYEGDLRFSAATSLISSCDSLQTDISGIASRSFTCGFLKPNTTYSFVLFFRNDFSENISLSLISGPVIKTADARICTSSSYKLPWGPLVTAPGTYSDTLKGKAGCDSLIQRVNVTFTNTPVIQNFNQFICSGGTYTLPWGPTVSLPGLYSDTIKASAGCDSLIRNITLSLKTTTYIDTTIGICTGQPYTLPWGDVVTTTGDYSKTFYSTSGCDSLVTTVHLIQNKIIRDSAYVSICGGQTYTLPWGQQASTSGIYRDTLRYKTGCDSVIKWVDLTVKQATTQTGQVSICRGSSYTLPWGETVNTPGIYRDTLKSSDGCDSLITEITLSINKDTLISDDVSICTGSYTLPWGAVVNSAGVYRDTLRYAAGCDSVIRVINLTVNTPLIKNDTAFICNGKTYKLPWGTVVNSPGAYRDTVSAVAGCDSLINILELVAAGVTILPSSASACSGGSYTLPWGVTVTTGGVYRDTLHYASGCDSVIREVTLTFNTPIINNLDTAICTGQSYLLSSGITADTTGLYRDTLRTVCGCDSLIRMINLTVKPRVTETQNASICSGGTYTLPWGTVVNSPGIYRDTLFYSTGCDSVIKEVNLTASSAALILKDTISICEGQKYNLPWGGLAGTTGIYSDTLDFSNGCDSIIRVVDLRVLSPVIVSVNASFCTGSTFMLPWGAMVSSSGVYRDTVRSVNGCDSLIQVVNLNENMVAVIADSVSFCAGSIYTLPWGAQINTPGTYADTLKHVTGGCDSVIRKVIASVNTTNSFTIDTTLCNGQAYLLPSGVVVNASGAYRDTLKATGGCDSAIYIINLTINTVTTSLTDTTISAGETYVLPWGTAISTAGVYRDTLHYGSGCDSLIRIVNLTVSGLPATTLSATICDGKSYVLPWGITVTTAGSYRDTVKNTSGLDSAIIIVNLGVQTAIIQATSVVSICQGQAYTLPWGTTVSAPGLYADTLRYQSGCDSVIRSVDVGFKSSSVETTTATVCAGQGYTLPWGTVVNSPGSYRDTLRYTSGCDSLIRIVNVEWITATTLNTNASICPGQSFTLPWGRVVSSAGTYRDTLFSVSGCDSVIRVIQLSTITALKRNTTAGICAGQSYTLPWGGAARASGIYSDTLKSLGGCDSLIQTVNLTVNPNPVVSLTKSNDIDCMLGSSKLRATGGTAYTWWPSKGLSDSAVFNPVATPALSTMYHVRVSSGNGCIAEDSILITVATGNPENGYLVPNAFTPDNDGLNDCFGVKHWGAVTDLNFTIYNRWGEIVFQTTNSSKCWDGTYKNSRLPTGTFVYLISAKTVCGPIQRKGTVTLIR